MKDKGYVKFSNNKNESVNFQLFPPKLASEDNFARHGSGKENGHPPIQIDLNDGTSSKLIFMAIQDGEDFKVTFL